jgi:hypothetical protein
MEWLEKSINRYLAYVLLYAVVIAIFVGLAPLLSISVDPKLNFLVAVIPVVLSELYHTKAAKIKFLSLQRDIISLKAALPQSVIEFKDFCAESTKALDKCNYQSDVYAIQTPVDPFSIHGGETAFKNYLTKTVEVLLASDPINPSIRKIDSYKRVIVINNPKDPKEIEGEIEKIEEFITTLYEELKKPSRSNKSLDNIIVGIICSKDIRFSPFSNLDVLLLKKAHLVIAFPKEHSGIYEWGSSIHINECDTDETKKIVFRNQLNFLSQLFENSVWNRIRTCNSYLMFSDLHDSNNLPNSEANIKQKVSEIIRNCTGCSSKVKH